MVYILNKNKMKKQKNYTGVMTISDAIKKSNFAKVLWENNSHKI